MRKLTYAIFSLLVITSSCKKVGELTKFNIDYNTSTTIPASTGINLPVNLFTPDIESNSESEFAINNDPERPCGRNSTDKINIIHQRPSQSGFWVFKVSQNFYRCRGAG